VQESRHRRARIGRFKPIADFDWNWPKKIERGLIERALTLEFIREGRNLALIGSNGLGKTMIARNIAHQAILAGYSVLSTTAAELIEDLRSCSPETLRRRLARYTRPHLLCIDEVGYLSYDSYAADLLYKVVDRRYERPGAKDLPSRSILITTNLVFRDWNSCHSRSSVTPVRFSSWWTFSRSGGTRSSPGGTAGNSRASSAVSSRSGGTGHVTPACAARARYSDTVPAPMPHARAISRWLSPFPDRPQTRQQAEVTTSTSSPHGPDSARGVTSSSVGGGTAGSQD
jgi:hypothetical protein